MTRGSRSRHTGRGRQPRLRRTAPDDAQLPLPLTPATHGGKRDGAGRPRIAAGKRRVEHLARLALHHRYPVHVTVRVRAGVPRLRGFKPAKVLRRALAAGCTRGGPGGDFRICQYSIQRNHLHLICEADDRVALARGVQGWSIRVARGLNAHWGRKGKLFSDRYHAEILTTPRQVKNALVYVLNNARKHGEDLRRGWADPFSSCWYFDGWRDLAWQRGCEPPTGPPPVAPAATWLLATGWWKHWGRISVDDAPRRSPAPSRPRQ